MGTVTYTQIFKNTLIGAAEVQGVNDSFSTIRSATGNSYNSGQLQCMLWTRASSTNNFSELDRGLLVFDTTALPSNATVIGANITINGDNSGGVYSSLGTTTLELVSSAPASNTTPAPSDYGSLGSTSFSSVNLNTISTNATTVFILNSSGLSNVIAAGYSKFGLRLGWDLNGAFGGTWASGSDTGLFWGFNSTATLSVTYTQPTTILTGISKLTGVSSIAAS